MKNRNSAEDGKCEVCPVDSTRCEAHFCFPSNKDKSGTRTNDIHDRSFQSKRSARHVRAFFHVTPSRKCTMHETSKFHLRFSPRALFIVCFSYDDYSWVFPQSPLLIFSISIEISKTFIVVRRFSNIVKQFKLKMSLLEKSNFLYNYLNII